VVLTRALRDMDGPAIPSRFLLRIEALLGDNAQAHREQEIGQYVQALDRQVPASPEYPRPAPNPSAAQRDVPIKVTALDRLLGDPYQFYAQEVLGLSRLDALDTDPFADPALRGTLAHCILERWHEACRSDPEADWRAIANATLEEENAHPLMMGLWRPRLYAALENVVAQVLADEAEGRVVTAWEAKGSMTWRGVRVHGRADRIDRMADGTLAIVDYKTGAPPSAAQVEAGFALQLGLLGLIAGEGDFEGLSGQATHFEYWSLARSKTGDFSYVTTPVKHLGSRAGKIAPDDFLPHHAQHLDRAIDLFINGSEPFTARMNPDYPGYNDYDQLMRLEEWERHLASGDAEDAV